MTKVVLKINCGESHPHVLAENHDHLIFSCSRRIFPASRFRLIFSWFLKLFLAKERSCFLCLTSLFLARFFAVFIYFFFCGFSCSAIFPFLYPSIKTTVVLGAVVLSVLGLHSFVACSCPVALDFFVDLMFIQL